MVSHIMKIGSPTERLVRFVPRIAVFLAGITAGAMSLARKKGGASDPEALKELRQATNGLESRLAAHESATATRFTKIESRLDDHETKIAEMPSTAQIVAAMEHVLAKSMTSLDDRLTRQANSIEILKTTVSQTDSVLERILESLDSLHAQPGPHDLDEEALLELTM
jgi:hypothetical protein